MKVSVIIPTYNEERSILDCLESLGKQNYTDFEIILVDDGSTDETRNLLNNASEIIKDFVVLTQNHKGAGAARNLGAQKAKGEILVFVDADMTFDEDFITKLIQPILNGNTVGTFSKQEHLANKTNPWARCWNLNRGLPKFNMHPDNYPDTQPVFRAILKSVFDRVGGFNVKAGYTDDWLADRVGQMATNASGAIFYHKNPDNLKEVFSQSKWMAKRKYKLGIVGIFVALVRVSLPISFITGFINTFRFKEPLFFIFKIVSDFGQFLGILEYNLKGSAAK